MLLEPYTECKVMTVVLSLAGEVEEVGCMISSGAATVSQTTGYVIGDSFLLEIMKNENSPADYSTKVSCEM